MSFPIVGPFCAPKNYSKKRPKQAKQRIVWLTSQLWDHFLHPETTSKRGPKWTTTTIVLFGPFLVPKNYPEKGPKMAKR